VEYPERHSPTKNHLYRIGDTSGHLLSCCLLSVDARFRLEIFQELKHVVDDDVSQVELVKLARDEAQTVWIVERPVLSTNTYDLSLSSTHNLCRKYNKLCHRVSLHAEGDPSKRLCLPCKALISFELMHVAEA
jgi:hypothetical protein|tara:strand:- start:590 stop:988 length:399 start_codon:yes stop_codon:yes gene_type:complete